jgi:SAM-dependent methyltransferase
MSQPTCCVCGSPLGDALYRSPANRSLTSLCQIHPSATVVHACSACGHLQSDPIADVDAYYDADYDILVGSEEEDQIYEVVDGKPIYRTAHQVETFLGKMAMPAGANLLDYGCAKSSTIRMLCSRAPRYTPHLFDVSARYIPFWKSFVRESNWSVHAVKPEWRSHFDIVTSFFSLEHIPRPAESMREIANLLRPGGSFYAIVPNVFTNIADFIVVDHCNHFTATSLARLMNDAGLDVLEIDARAHRGAYVIVARKHLPNEISRLVPDEPAIERALAELKDIADFWDGASERIRAYEATLAHNQHIAVYGAGFYGAFIFANLAYPERIACYLDQNPFLQGSRFEGKPILAPDALPAGIDQLLVGLNPAHANRIIAEIPALAARDLNYFYL